MPLVAYSLDTQGWRGTAFVSGILIIVLGLPLAQVIRRRPEEYGEVVDGRQPPDGRHDFVRRVRPVEGGAGVEDRQRALKCDLFVLVRAAGWQRRLSTLLEATLSLSKGRGRI